MQTINNMIYLEVERVELSVTTATLNYMFLKTSLGIKYLFLCVTPCAKMVKQVPYKDCSLELRFILIIITGSATDDRQKHHEEIDDIQIEIERSKYIFLR